MLANLIFATGVTREKKVAVPSAGKEGRGIGLGIGPHLLKSLLNDNAAPKSLVTTLKVICWQCQGHSKKLADFESM